MTVNDGSCLKSGRSFKRAFSAIYIAVFAFMLLLTAVCPYISDDWHFKFVWRGFNPTAEDTAVSSIGDIFESVKNYYMLSGGRAICHFIVFCLVNTNKWVFNLLNALIFVIFGRLIYSLIYGEKRGSPLCLILIYFSAILFLPSFGDNFIWLSGSVNYLWSATLMLFCVKLISDNFGRLTFRKAAFISLPIMFSAATNETTGGILVVFMVLTYIERKIKFSPVYLIPLLITVPGILSVILAPGNVNRASNIEQVEIFDFGNALTSICGYFRYMSASYWWELWIIVLSVLLCWEKRDGVIANVMKHKYIIVGIIGIIALFPSSFVSVRPTLFGAVFILIALWKSAFMIIDYFARRKKEKNMDLKFLKRKLELTVLIFGVYNVSEYLFSLDLALMTAGEYIFIELMIISAFKFISMFADDEKSKQQLEKLKAFSKKLLPKSALIATAVFSVVIVYNSVLYLNYSYKANKYIDQFKSLIENGQIEDSYELTVEAGKDCVLIPKESFGNYHTEYTLEWVAKYYGYDIDYSPYMSFGFESK